VPLAVAMKPLYIADFLAIVVGTDTSRVRKGKNFSCNEKRQLCLSFLAISHDLIHGNGQISVAL
jgi:hypothetical protein